MAPQPGMHTHRVDEGMLDAPTLMLQSPLIAAHLILESALFNVCTHPSWDTPPHLHTLISTRYITSLFAVQVAADHR